MIPAISLIQYSDEEFKKAKCFVFEKWKQRAIDSNEDVPTDLSRSCKYGTLFMNTIYGGSIQGHYQHQYNVIDNHIVDLSDNAADVLRLLNPYHHDAEFFKIPEQIASLNCCIPRVDQWVAEFMLLEHAAAHAA